MLTSRILGIVPKSGEKIIKEAIGSFRKVISQLKKGIELVQKKLKANQDKMDSIAVKQVVLEKAIEEAIRCSANLEAILNGKFVTIEDTDTGVGTDNVSDDTDTDTDTDTDNNAGEATEEKTNG